MYTFPIDYDFYEQDEVVILVEFLAMIEDANTGKVDKNVLLKKYNQFRSIVNNVAEEKTIDRDFEKLSGYSIFKTIKKYKGQ